MSAQNDRLFLDIFGVFWVGGWGWIMYRNPEWIVRMYVRFGFGKDTPKFRKLIRVIGAVEIGFAAISLIGGLLMLVLGFY